MLTSACREPVTASRDTDERSVGAPCCAHKAAAYRVHRDAFSETPLDLTVDFGARPRRAGLLKHCDNRPENRSIA